MTGRPPHAGLRHVALLARRFEETVAFYRDVLGMRVEWQPDADNVYLTSGVDNLAIHRAQDAAAKRGQRLDHIGFVVNQPADVDRWHAFLAARAWRRTRRRARTGTAPAASTAKTRKAAWCNSSTTRRWRNRSDVAATGGLLGAYLGEGAPTSRRMASNALPSTSAIASTLRAPAWNMAVALSAPQPKPISFTAAARPATRSNSA